MTTTATLDRTETTAARKTPAARGRGMPAELMAEYFARIGYTGTPAADLATLTELHRRHVDTFTWENLDFLLGKRIDRDPRVVFDKIVRGTRGACCYEGNGLFAWMLEALGFRFAMHTGGAMREKLGDFALGNHLLLIVQLDRPYLVDVGLGNGQIEPIPLVAGEYSQRYMTFRLERLEGSWFRFHNHAGLMPPSIDFSTELKDDDLLNEKLLWAQTGEDSSFWKVPMVHRHSADGLTSAIGGNLVKVDLDGTVTATPIDPEAYTALLDRDFRLRGPELAALKPTAPVAFFDGPPA